MNETSSKHGSRLSATSKRVYDRLDAPRSDSRSVDPEDRPRSVNVPAVLGLVALTAVTSWVVTRISVWLVPVYMGAMTLIFAVPRTNRPRAAAKTLEAPAIETAGGEEPTAADDPRGASTSSIPAEPPADVSDVPGASPPKPRKRRVKARRSVKGADGDTPAAPAAWVRVGPGKFVRADVREPAVEAPPAPESISQTLPIPDAGAESDATSQEAQPDPQSTEDRTTADVEAPDEAGSLEPGSPELSAAVEVSETIAEEHDIASSTLGEGEESTVFEVSETIAEEHDIASSTLGEGEEPACLPEDVDLEGPRPVPVASSTSAPEPVVEAGPVSASADPSASSLIPSTTTTRDRGSIRPVVLLGPQAAETARLRAGASVVESGRLRNVRSGEARRRLSTRTGRGADVRLLQRSVRIRSRLVHVERDFQPRSPPSRA